MAVKKLNALGAYIFAGGFTLGVRKHFEILTHFEDGPYGVQTAISNGLIKEAHITPDEWPIDKYAGKVDFLYANPPCAPWSMASAGRATHWTDDPRLNAVKRCYALHEQIEPTVWAWESVRPAWVKGRALVETIARKAMERGYSATVLLVEGTRHGVAQRRPRFFLVLHDRFIEWEESGQKKEPTVDGAFKEPFKTETVVDIGKAQLKLLKKAKPGERLHRTFGRLNPEVVANRKEGEKVKGRPSFQRVRLIGDSASHTLTGGPHLIHPTKDRLISVEESAALCGYPRSFKFIGSAGKQYAQVAQAVMPPVGEYLGRMVSKACESGKKIKKPFFEQVEIFTDRIERQLLLPPVGTMNLEVTAAPKPEAFVTTRQQKTLGKISGKSGSGFRIRQLLVKGWSPEKILVQIRDEFPTSKAKNSDVYWNKRKLEQQGGIP